MESDVPGMVVMHDRSHYDDVVLDDVVTSPAMTGRSIAGVNDWTMTTTTTVRLPSALADVGETRRGPPVGHHLHRYIGLTKARNKESCRNFCEGMPDSLWGDKWPHALDGTKFSALLLELAMEHANLREQIAGRNMQDMYDPACSNRQVTDYPDACKPKTAVERVCRGEQMHATGAPPVPPATSCGTQNTDKVLFVDPVALHRTEAVPYDSEAQQEADKIVQPDKASKLSEDSCCSKGKRSKLLQPRGSRVEGWEEGDEQVMDILRTTSKARPKQEGVFDEKNEKTYTALQRFVSSRSFALCSAAVILINTIYLGIQADILVKSQFMRLNNVVVDPQGAATIFYAEVIFTCVFALELLIRLVCWRLIFFTGSQRWWHFFDAVIVIASLFEVIAPLLGTEFSSGLGALRTVRLVRIFRLLRLADTVAWIRSMVRSMQTMVHAVGGVARSFMPAMLLLFTLIYIFCLLFLEIVRNHIEHITPEMLKESKALVAGVTALEKYYGSLFETWANLMACVTGGYDWVEIAFPLKDSHTSKIRARSYRIRGAGIYKCAHTSGESVCC